MPMDDWMVWSGFSGPSRQGSSRGRPFRFPETPWHGMWMFRSDSSRGISVAVEEGRTAIRVQPLPRPTFAFTTRLEDSKGNGDGLLQTGETVELALNLENVGKGESVQDPCVCREI